MNHKCHKYNLRLKEDNSGMVAVRPIARGEMLTFNYLTTEWNVIFPFSCLCGEPGCFRTIKGFKNMSKDEQQEIYKAGNCSAYVKSMYENTLS